MTKSIRARSNQLLASLAIGAAVLTLTPILGVWTAKSAQAQYIIDAEFRTALSPYGRWQNHSRWGEVWLPDPVPADWRPYTRGRWIYTDDWGWYWEAADEEAAWGWVAYHYGRWVNDPELGWLWTLTKIFAVAFVVIWLRVAYPRLREDQLQRLCWLVLVPVALGQLALTVGVKLAIA